jgi:hypothetical protein
VTERVIITVAAVVVVALAVIGAVLTVVHEVADRMAGGSGDDRRRGPEPVAAKRPEKEEDRAA